MFLPRSQRSLAHGAVLCAVTLFPPPLHASSAIFGDAPDGRAQQPGPQQAGTEQQKSGQQGPEQAPSEVAPSAHPASVSAPLPPHVSASHRARAERLYLQGAKQLEQSSFEEAAKTFAQAIALDPTRGEYLQALALSREHRITDLLQQSTREKNIHPEESQRLLEQARSIDPENPRVRMHTDSSAGAAPAQQPSSSRSKTPLTGRAIPLTSILRRPVLAQAIEPRFSDTRHSFHLVTDERSMAEAIAKAYGLRAVMDPDLPVKRLRMDLDDADFPTAMRIFGMLSNSFYTPLDEQSLLIAEDTPANRDRLERLLEEVVPLPGYSVEQINEVSNMLRSVFELKQVSVQPQLGSVVVRAPADMVHTIDQLLGDLVASTPQVVIDLRLYSVDKTKARNLGIVLPQSLSAFSLAAEAQNIVSSNSSVIQQLISSGVLPADASLTEIAAYLVLVAGLGSDTLLQNSFLLFGGGITTGLLSLGSNLTINLALTESDARELDSVQLRAGDKQASTFKSGTRYPIQTSLYSDMDSTSSSALSGASVNGVSLSSLLSQYLGTSSLSSGSVIPQIQYEDLGLTVTATPRVERNGFVAMHLDMKISALTGSTLNGIPVLANRQFTSDVIMKDGESALMTSNVTETESSAITGIPALSEIPGFQGTTNKNTNKTHNNMVLIITPHIVEAPHQHLSGPYLPLSPQRDID